MTNISKTFTAGFPYLKTWSLQTYLTRRNVIYAALSKYSMTKRIKLNLTATLCIATGIALLCAIADLDFSAQCVTLAAYVLMLLGEVSQA